MRIRRTFNFTTCRSTRSSRFKTPRRRPECWPSVSKKMMTQFKTEAIIRGRTKVIRGMPSVHRWVEWIASTRVACAKSIHHEIQTPGLRQRISFYSPNKSDPVMRFKSRRRLRIFDHWWSTQLVAERIGRRRNSQLSRRSPGETKRLK
jgi:hypothetical protein